MRPVPCRGAACCWQQRGASGSVQCLVPSAKTLWQPREQGAGGGRGIVKGSSRGESSAAGQQQLAPMFGAQMQPRSLCAGQLPQLLMPAAVELRLLGS